MKIKQMISAKIAEIKDGIEASNQELRETRKTNPELFRKKRGER